MREKVNRLIASMLLLTSVQGLSAKCGNVDYSWGAEALATMHDYVVTMMMSVIYLIYAIASIVAIVSSFQIYYKIQMGEEGMAKNITMLIGAILFIIGASVVLPAFFGYQV